MNKQKAVVTLLVLGLVTTAITSHAQTFQTLVTFNGTDGANPAYMSLVQGVDGNFYGTTEYGGTGTGNADCAMAGCGTVFTVTPAGTLTTLYNFCSQPNCFDGAAPATGLVLGSNGNLYGTSSEGGAHRCGTVFEITSAGKLTTLHHFSCAADGSSPEAPLVLGADGAFYGTAHFGGASSCNGVGCGTVFKITANRRFTTLHSFNGADGENPYAGLVQTANGNFYGTTYSGGANSLGTIFEMTPQGDLMTLQNLGGTDGSYPFSGLIQGSDGNLWGVTSEGGANGLGTVFAMAPQGALTTIYSFSSGGGAYPIGELVQATDSNFYGTTDVGGANDDGTIFEITAGSLSTLYVLGSDGAEPNGGLVQGTNGNFYGATTFGGSNCYLGGCGTIFSLSTGLGPFVGTLPAAAKVEAKVGILGTDLTGAISVMFNGTSAQFKVSSPTLILTHVPEGATTGTIQVMLPSGVLSSNVPFYVLP